MSLEQKIEELTAAVVALTQAFSVRDSASLVKAKPVVKAIPAVKAIPEDEPVDPVKDETEPEQPARGEEADREVVRARLVAVQNSVDRDTAVALLEKFGEAKTVGKVPPKNFKKLIAACDAALLAALQGAAE